MSRKRTRQIVLIAVLLLILALLAALYTQYRMTRKLGLDLDFDQPQAVLAPEYLYSFAGAGSELLLRPIGVLVDNGRAYVTDSRRGVVDVFTVQGKRVAVWGRGKLNTPLYIAKHPITGDFYVSDRRLHGVFIFSPDGAFKGEFKPNLPKSELPRFDTKGVQWSPVALTFAPDGALYATEILNGHRLIIFDAKGKFLRAVGDAAIAESANVGEGAFQFPNSVKVSGDEVWVADSNNRRIQVFTRAGDFKRFIPTQGLPRGFDFLPKENENDPQRIVVVDTLSHDGTIWDVKKGQQEVKFGTRGVLEAQFSYPNDTSIDDNRRIYIADSANGRVQVWGWPVVPPVPAVTESPGAWAAFGSPLVLLPLLLLLRKRRYFVTRDFVMALYDLGELDRMPKKRIVWEVLPEDYEVLREFSQGNVSLERLLHSVDFSKSDAKSLQDRYELSEADAIILSVAKRAKLFGTESNDLRKMAQMLEIKTVNHLEFIQQNAIPDSRSGEDAAGGD